MADNDNSGLVLLGLGLILGTLFTYLILKKKGDAPSPQPQIQYFPQYSPQQCPPCPPCPQVPASAQPPGIISVIPVPSCAPSCTPPAVPTIQNDETWEIKKDKRGRLDKITVHRQVRPLGSSVG